MAITPISDITNAQLTTGVTSPTGNGVFDEMMKAVVAHLHVEYLAKRITSDKYPEVYLGAMQIALTQAVTFLLQRPITERQAATEESKKVLVVRQAATEEANKLLVERQAATEEANKLLVASKVATEGSNKGFVDKQSATEGAKKLLVERQTKGFDDDAKQKLMKQMLDSWSVAYSVAKDANSIPDSIKVNPIDAVTKSAMVGLGIMAADAKAVIPNSLGEI